MRESKQEVIKVVFFYKGVDNLPSRLSPRKAIAAKERDEGSSDIFRFAALQVYEKGSIRKRKVLHPSLHPPTHQTLVKRLFRGDLACGLANGKSQKLFLLQKDGKIVKCITYA